MMQASPSAPSPAGVGRAGGEKGGAMHRQTAEGWAGHRALAGADPDAGLRPLAAVLGEDGPCAPALAVRFALNVAALVRAARAERGEDVSVDPRDVLLGADGRVLVREFEPAAAERESSSLTRLGGVERVFFSLVCGRLVTSRSDARDLRHRLPADAPAALRQLLDACLGIGAEPAPGTLDELIVGLSTVEAAVSPGAHPDRRAVDELRLRVEHTASALRRALDLATRFGVDAAALPDRDTLAATLFPAGIVDAGREPAIARRALEAVAGRLDDTMGTLDRVLRENLGRQFSAVVDLARRLRASPDGLLERHEAAALDDGERATRQGVATAPPADAAETVRDFELALESLRAVLEGRMRERLAASLARVATLIDAIEQTPDGGEIAAELEPARLRAACEEQIAAADFAAASAVLAHALARLEDRAGMVGRGPAGSRVGLARNRSTSERHEAGSAASVTDPALPAGQQSELRELLERLSPRPGAPSPEAVLREEGERLLAGIDVARARRMAPEVVEQLVAAGRAAQAARAAGDEPALLAELVRTVDILGCLARALGQGATPGPDALAARSSEAAAATDAPSLLGPDVNLARSGAARAVLVGEASAAAAESAPLAGAVRVSSAAARGAYSPARSDAQTGGGSGGLLDLWIDDARAAAGTAPPFDDPRDQMQGRPRGREPGIAVMVFVAAVATLVLGGVLPLRRTVMLHAGRTAPLLVPSPRILAAWPPAERLLGPGDRSWIFTLVLDGPPDPVLGPHWSIDGRSLATHGASLVMPPHDPRRPRQPFVLAARIGSGFEPGRLRIWRVEPTLARTAAPAAQSR